MPDNDKPVEPTVQPEVTKGPTIEELAAKLEQITRAQSGSDKAYQEAAKKAKELEAENEALKKEKMTEKERAEFELAKQRAEIEAKSREVAEATLRLAKVRLMGESGIPLEYADYISGNNDQEIANSIKTFNERIDKLVGERVNKKLITSEPPKAGTVAVKDEIPKNWKESEKSLLNNR